MGWKCSHELEGKDNLMPNINGKSKILSFSVNPTTIEAIEAAVKGEEDFVLLDRSSLQEGIQSSISKLQPDILLIDNDFEKEETYHLVDSIATQFPSVAIVAIMPEDSVHLSDRVILSGARAFILLPFTKKNFLVTLRRVVELLKRNNPSFSKQELSVPLPTKPKNTYTIFSPKGGSGVTTIAVNLAIALRQLINEPVLLMDGKHLFGHVALMLNIRTANSITDLISHAGMLDKQLINQVVVDHVSGIKVLPSPIAITEAQGIRPDDLFKVIIELQSTYPVILIDAGNFLNENAVTYMDASDQIIVVLNPNLASVRDAKQFIEVCHSLAYPKEKIMLVLNNTGHKADIQQEEIEKILKQKIICEIPGDDNFVLSSLNEGVPVLLKNARHPVSKAITLLANKIKSIIVEANAEFTTLEKSKNSEVLNKTSRLG
jgi:pilus assembly protein CpaE